MRKFSILLLFTIFLFYLSIKPALAAVLLEDDFNDGNANDGNPVDWEEHLGSRGSWAIENGEYVGIVVKDRPEDLPTYSIAGDENWSNYQFDVRIKGEAGVDKTVLFRYRSLQETYRLVMISSWPDYYGDKIYLIKHSPNPTIIATATFVNKQNVWYKLSIELHSSNIKLYIDDSMIPIINFTDENNPIFSGKIGLLAWPGFYQGYGSVTINRFDDVAVTSIDVSPSPTPAPLQPLVFLPGLGASWNHRAMILDEPTPQDQWKMTPGVKNYDGIIQTLINSGYAQNTNLFVFNYDWRKPIGDIAEDLRNYINNVINLPPGIEIDLVGHSLGGMVARTYLQNNPLDHHINQVITLGSPHMGAPQVYYLWEGADFNKTLGFAWQRIGAGILLQLKKRGFENSVSALQHAVPGLKGLLPTFPYLKQNSIPKPLEDMNQKNLWLEGLNLSLPPHLTSKLASVAGIDLDTLRWLDIKPRTRFDELLGKWEDGRPVDEEFASGDSTVLEMSADLNNELTVSKLPEINHGDLVESESGQQEIMNLLGLSPTEIVPASGLLPEQLLVFQLASPVNMSVFLRTRGWWIGEGVGNDFPGGIYSSEDDLIIIPNPPGGRYDVYVTGEDEGGDYRLLIGYINNQQDIWREESGHVENGQSQIHFVGFSPNLNNNRSILINLTKRRLEQVETLLNSCPNPPRNSFQAGVQNSLKRVNRIISLNLENKETKSQQELEKAIKDLILLERKIIDRKQSCGENINNQLIPLLREARDYLLQAHEL